MENDEIKFRNYNSGYVEIDEIKLRNIVLDAILNSSRERFIYDRKITNKIMFPWFDISVKFRSEGVMLNGIEDKQKCISILKKFDCFEFINSDLGDVYIKLIKLPLDYIGINKEMVKDAVLNYMEEKKISSMSIKEISCAIEKEIRNSIGRKVRVSSESFYSDFSSFVLEECIRVLKEFDCFEFDNDNIVHKQTLKERLQNKFNIAIDSIRDNIGEIAIAAASIVVVGGMIGLTINGINLNKKYENSILVDNDKEYSMKDIYVVYTKDEVHFCTRNLHKIHEEEKIHGEFRRGYGGVDEYYYRDEVYDYYDIKTGNKICEDHQDGFYIEKLMDFYGKLDMKGRNYKIGVDEITNDIDNDYLLSRDPGLRRK